MNQCHLHHIHLFCENISVTIKWWQENLDATICFDGAMGGSRNVFMRVGEGRLHLYDQKPKGISKSAIHHVGIRVDDINKVVSNMKSNGVSFRNAIRYFDGWAYVMCLAPDSVLLEIFEVSGTLNDKDLDEYFSDL